MVRAALSPGHSSTPATRCPAAAGPPSPPGSTTPSNTRTGCRSSAPDQARPGDIVAYDWGGGTDFSGDGHIGFLASNVQNGQFNALEGNNADAVNLVPRQLGGGPNIVFIRVNGDAPAGGATPPIPDPTATPGTPVATAATAGTPPTPPAPTLHGPGDEQFFDQAIAARPERKVGAGEAMFIKAIDPSQQVKPAAVTAAPAPVAEAASAPPAASTPADAAAPGSTAAPADHAAAAIDLSSTATDYPGDHATQAQLAQWLGRQAQKAGLPPELPVMASLVESGVRNLDYGDRDSVGFFQMRTSYLGPGALRRLPAPPRAPGQVVHRPSAGRQAQGDRERRRELRPGPGQIRRVDRRRRAVCHRVPQPLPGAPRRGARPARRLRNEAGGSRRPLVSAFAAAGDAAAAGGAATTAAARGATAGRPAGGPAGRAAAGGPAAAGGAGGRNRRRRGRDGEWRPGPA